VVVASAVMTAIARERWELLVQDQPEHYREILRLRLDGQDCRSIGEKLGLHEETARRFLKKRRSAVRDE
jgi:hypothetical protein